MLYSCTHMATVDVKGLFTFNPTQRTGWYKLGPRSVQLLWWCAACRLDSGGDSTSGSSMAKPSPVTAMRRESFLYRSDSDFDMSPKSLSRTSSLNANDSSVY